MSRRTFAIVAALLLLVAAGCGKSSKKNTSKTTSTAAASTPATTSTAAQAPSNGSGCSAAKPTNKGAQHLSKPKTLLPRDKPVTLVLQTNCGEIDIALDVKRAPRTASSVAYLVRKGFYNGLDFHRIAKLPTGGDFVIQGGDPTGTGNGGPGYSVHERPPANLQYTRGIVAMAKTEIEPSGTSGSQFFIVTGQNVGLPPEYALVGKVTGSFGAVDKIAAEPVSGPEGSPLSPVVIKKATLNVG
jgi:peptidyl-prolyl cis-trans isomerase B (cyclophilin B)